MMKRKNILSILLLFSGSWLLHGQSMFTRVLDTSNPAVTFTSTAAGYKGVSWIDMNGDHWPDLFAGQMFIFKNLGNGHFEQQENLNGAGVGQIASGSSWGDIDNDGDPDCITSLLTSGLHLNNGDFTFQLATTDLPDFESYSSWDCALADVDQNGLLDLTFVHACCGFHPSGPFSCRLYLQTTPGVYEKVSGYEFTDQQAPYTIPVWSDYDLDGDVDLFIGAGPAGTPGADYCYKNLLNESGLFSLQRLTTMPFDALQDGQTYNFPDYDNDGDLDICLTNYGGAKCRFWRNEGNGNYTSLNTPFTIQNAFLANVWGDINNDGFQDVLISLDNDPNIRYYQNKGDGTFAPLKILGTADAKVTGMALADYDNDGDLDVYVNGPAPARALFRNDTVAAGRNWATFSLEGTTSNRSAIGTIIRVKTTVNGVAVWQIREVSAHNSFQSQSDLRQHFGLNNATLIDSVQIHWPSGIVQEFSQLMLNTFYHLKEGETPTVVVSEPKPSHGITLFPNPTTQTLHIRVTDADITAKLRSVEVYNISGKLILSIPQRDTSDIQINVTSLAPAPYFVRAIFDGKILTGSFIMMSDK